MKNLSLIQRFSLITLVAMILFALGFGKIVGDSMERNMLKKSIEETGDIVFQNVVKHFTEDDLREPKTGEEYNAFYDEIMHLSLGQNIESIEIWNRDMVVVWSSNRSLVGRKFTDNDELMEAFRGNLISEITDEHSEQNESGKIVHQEHHGDDIHSETGSHHGETTVHGAGHAMLLELYIPIRFHPDKEGEIGAVFEIYQNIDHLYMKIDSHKRLIWFWSVIGFTALYIVLFGIMWNASKRIEHQTQEIRRSKQDWEKTFNSISDIITVHNKDFNIIQSNRAANEMLSLPTPLSDKLNKCYEYYHGTDSPLEGCPSCVCMETGEPATFELFEPHLQKFIEIRSIPRMNDSNMEGFIHVVRDISERKHHEKLIQTQLNRLSALRSIDRAIISSVDLTVTLDFFLEQTIQHLHVDAASVLILNEHSHTLDYAVRKGFRSNVLKHTKLRLGQGNAGRAAVERRVITIPNLREDTDGFVTSKNFADEEFVAYFGIPLVVKGKVMGVLELFHRSEMSVDSDWMEFMEAVADLGAIAIDNATLFNDLQRSNTELVLAYDSTIEGWSRALDLRDKETEGHTQRVSEMTVHVARELGIREENIVIFRRGALLHDMGKLGIPDSILLKPGPLTDEEWKIMKLHPVYVYDMLFPIKYLRPALDIPYYHHEKWDGTGYPRGLKGKDIPVAARIFAIVDVWDALRSDRPYRAAWPEEKVSEHICSLSGTHFDPEIVDVFLRLLKELEESVIIHA